MLVENAAATQRRQAVDLEDPRLERLVEHDVEAEDLEAAALAIPDTIHLLYDRVLDGNERLDDDVFAVFK